MARVQVTNDVALESKESCVRTGYYSDRAATMMYSLVGRKPRRRTALVNLGYHLRVHGVTQAVQWFLGLESVLTSEHSPQLLSLGGGHDTLHWRLRQDEYAGAAAASLHTFDVDLPDVAASKAQLVESCAALLEQCGARRPQSQNPEVLLDREQYTIVSSDVCNTAAVTECLLAAQFNVAAPTLVLSECVLAYVLPEQGDGVIRWAAELLTGPAAFVDYCPIGINDRFGQHMAAHFAEYGTELSSARRYDTPQQLDERLLGCGWGSANTTLLTDIYLALPKVERTRLLELEMFDEFEELFLTCQHYAIAVATHRVNEPTLVFRPRKEHDDVGVKCPDLGIYAQWIPAPALNLVDYCRWNSATAVFNGESVVFCGGYGGSKQSRLADAGVINLSTGELRKLSAPPTTATVSCTLSVGPGDTILHFGGRSSPAKPSSTLLRFDPKYDKWTELTAVNNGVLPPSPRWRHVAAWTSHDQLVVHGGQGTKGHVVDAMAVGACGADDTYVWQSVTEEGDVPGPRHSHCGAVCADALVIYGGMGPVDILGGLYSATITKCKEKSRELYVRWTALDVLPPLPRRFGQSCTSINATKLCVVGGIAEEPIPRTEQIILVVSFPCAQKAGYYGH